MTYRDGGGATSFGWRRGTLLGVLLLATWPAAAQEADPTGDIIVTPARTPPPFETRYALGTAAIDRIAANAADEVVRRLPSVYVPVNSRGEAIAFVRGAAERQVAVFYDGAAINVPWDNRLDLSMLPAGLVGRAQVAAAPLAPRYGVNALGAVSFAPARPDAFGARGLVGSGNIRDLAGVAPLTVGATDLTIGASYATRAGETVADDAALPFAQAGTLRTNTDRDLASIFAQASTRAGDHRLSFTAFHVAGDKGIAPESDRASGARFWRYPTLRHTLLSGKAGVMLGDTTTLDVIGWYQRFDQTIDSYTDATYRRRDTQEVDRDRTVGTRVLLSQAAGPTRVTASLNLLESTHDQRDTGFTNGAPPLRLPAFLRYRQRNASVGLDTVTALTDRLEMDLGGGYDRVAYVDTGDKPPIDAAEGWTGRAGLAWRAAAGWRLRATLGRKIRAPTMRELFGQALNRFLINPDLRPERVVSAELGADWTRDDLSLSLVAFAQDLDGTIDQRNVGRLRQRINLPGSTVRGLEATAAWQPAPGWSLGGSATLTRTRRKEPPAGTSDRLAEKPDLLARLYGERVAVSGFGVLAELLHVGRAYSADADGVLVALPRSTALNLRVSQRIDAADGAIELFARGDNLIDTAIVPQLGLPAPGRTFRIGLSVRGI
ncbi:TonB-dependent receptor [Sphingomonas sp. TZW2008]|uniref:TonB-dependent receptor n=1 Tax=Sphingomonas sp. TZW2008 TaxID=1917973 RepID=UPI000A270020|nr:TonB-dependent receptor [Sphingomonas sp. TZW2008]